MGSRSVDWLDLCEIALRKDAADRLVEVAGLPAAVKKSRGTDVGFVVQAASEVYAGDDYWELRTQRELILLRHLVTAGQVTVSEPDPEPDPDDAMETVEVISGDSYDVVRTFRLCGICGAGPETPHDTEKHTAWRSHADRED